jgi:hypothetical protein
LQAGSHELGRSFDSDVRRQGRRVALHEQLDKPAPDNVSQFLLQSARTRRRKFGLRYARLIEADRVDDVLSFARDIAGLGWLTLDGHRPQSFQQSVLRINFATRLCLNRLRILCYAGQQCVISLALLGSRLRVLEILLDGIQRPLPLRAD